MNRIFILLLILMIAGLPGKSSGADTLRVYDAVALALQNNFGISLAKNELNAAGITNSIGAAGMLPKLDLTGSKTKTVNNTKQEFFNGTSKESKNAATNNFNSSLQMTWTLFDGLNMFIQKSKLNELENLSEIQLRSVIESTMADVLQTYYGIVTQEALAKVYHDALQISEDRKDFAQARLNLGSGSELSVLQATVDMNSDSANLIRQNALIENLKSDLNRLLCRDLEENFEVSQGIPVTHSMQLKDLVAKADQTNPDLLIARNAISLANLAVKELRSAEMPRINFNTGLRYTKSSSDADVFKFSRTYGYNLGLSMTYNIFNGFTNRQKISVARIRSQSAEIDLKNARLDVQTNVKQVYTDYITNLKLVEFETSSLDFARHNFAVAEEKYRLGSLNNVEFRESQSNLVGAEQRLLSALYQCKLAETELLRLSGQLSAEIK